MEADVTPNLSLVIVRYKYDRRETQMHYTFNYAHIIIHLTINTKLFINTKRFKNIYILIKALQHSS